MSRGPGHVQRTVLAALAKRPGQWLSLTSLTMEAFPGEEQDHKRRESVRRACHKLAKVVAEAKDGARIAKSTDHRGQGKGPEVSFKYVPSA